MNWPDILAIVLVLAAAIFGLRRGFWSELVFLLGVCLAFILSAWLTPRLSPLIPGPGSMFYRTVSAMFFLLLCGVFFLLILWIGGKGNRFLPEKLVGVNKFLGLGLGLVKGVALAGLFYYLLILPRMPVSWRDDARDSRFAPVALSLDIVALDELAKPFPVFAPISRNLGDTLQKVHTTPGGALVVVREHVGLREHA